MLNLVRFVVQVAVRYAVQGFDHLKCLLALHGEYNGVQCVVVQRFLGGRGDFQLLFLLVVLGYLADIYMVEVVKH